MIENRLDQNKYAKIARQAAAESCVLLQNDREVLPLKKETQIALFGRGFLNYYKSGIGSGGLVNTEYVISILDALENCPLFVIEPSAIETYRKWNEKNPIDIGQGWGTVPWSQKEMPLEMEVVKKAHENADVALISIGRTAGEDQDNSDTEGSFRLSKDEKSMLEKVCAEFENTVVLLNVGNIIDMSWVDEYNPAAVLYVWQGGQEGGNGVVDVLSGRVNPCGKLTDTIAYDLTDYPSTPYFGDSIRNYYREDIYVGYRYFETFAKEKVQYPFGYGLSYTSFEIKDERIVRNDRNITVRAKVKNTGPLAGKEVIQIYISAPQGVLGKPARVLAGFHKTRNLKSGEEEELTIICPKSYFTSYDETGVTGNKSCMVLEAGTYEVYLGTDVRTAKCVGNWNQELEIVEELHEACAPLEAFERYCATIENGTYKVKLDKSSVRTVDPQLRRQQRLPAEIEYTGDRGFQLSDVKEQKVTMKEFIAQLSDEELIDLFHGEGMCSLKVTYGTAGAFGGLTDRLKKYGIPPVCCADGPSGIRMDCGTKAFLLPNGTAIGCTFNLELVQELFAYMGVELIRNRVDTLLGPGINIHRNPLNGRNFEYVSEDPVLTGQIAVAQLQGMETQGVTGTIKHYSANNQEQNRCVVEAIVSERALREIYLKGFEIAVKDGNARSIMTTYGPVNGIWTAGNFDLNTTILRDEWNFQGIVMTDWWGTANWEGEHPTKTNRAPMVIAQNDLYMCCSDAVEELSNDNVVECLQNGVITRAELQRNAANLLSFALDSPAMRRQMGEEEAENFYTASNMDNQTSVEGMNIHIYEADSEGIIIEAEDAVKFWTSNSNCMVVLSQEAEYELTLHMKSESAELAQIPISIYVDNIYRKTISIRGTRGNWITITETIGDMKKGTHFIRMNHMEDGTTVDCIQLKKGK